MNDPIVSAANDLLDALHAQESTVLEYLAALAKHEHPHTIYTCGKAWAAAARVVDDKANALGALVRHLK